jgi:hypothetical protein
MRLAENVDWKELIGSNLDMLGKNVKNYILRITTVSVTVSVSVR